MRANLKTIVMAAMLVFPLVSSLSTMAGSIKCQGKIFEDGQIKPATKNEIRAKCGNPDEERHNDWVYKDYGENPRVLHFNDAGELESIQEGGGIDP